MTSTILSGAYLESNIHYCNICCAETSFDDHNNCDTCGNPLNAELSEKDEEIPNLAYENKMMAEALKKSGFSQEKISTICSGNLSNVISTKDKKYYTKDGVYFDCNRWYVDALTYIENRGIDIVPIQVIVDTEDSVIVEVVLQDEFDIDKLKKHMREYFNDMLNTYPENIGEEEINDAKDELDDIITAMRQAQDDGFDYITLEAE